MKQPDGIAIFDGHNDAVHYMAEYRAGGRDFLARSDDGHLDLPRAREGGLIGGLFALFAASNNKTRRDRAIVDGGYAVPLADALDPAEARRQIDTQFDALSRLVARAAGQIRFAVGVDDIVAARRDGAFVMVLHMEGADAIDPGLDYLGRLHAAGLRSLGLTWSRPNLFGNGVPFAYPRSPDTGPGLTPAGKDLVRACNRLGILIDLAHLNERGFWDVAEVSTAPLVVTHAGAHAVCPSTRNLTDRQLDAIRDSDGVVGLNFAVNDVRPDGRREPDTPLDVMVHHLAYLVDRLGADRVALGSDFDGTVVPRAIKDASGLPRLVAALRAHGFDEPTLHKIALDNWLRVLRLTWG